MKKVLLVGILLLSLTLLTTKGMSQEILSPEKTYLEPKLIVRLANPKSPLSISDCISAKSEYEWNEEGLMIRSMWCNLSDIKTEYKYKKYLYWSELQSEDIVLFVPYKNIIFAKNIDNENDYILFDLEIEE